MVGRSLLYFTLGPEWIDWRISLRACHPLNHCSNISVLLEFLKHEYKFLEEILFVSWVWYWFCLCSGVCVSRVSSPLSQWPFGCLYLDEWGGAQDKMLQNLRPPFQDFVVEENTCSLPSIQGEPSYHPDVSNVPEVFWTEGQASR